MVFDQQQILTTIIRSCPDEEVRRHVAEQIERAADALGNMMMPECYSYLFHTSYMQVALAFTGCGMARCRFHPSLARQPLAHGEISPRCRSPTTRCDLATRARMALGSNSNKMMAAVTADIRLGQHCSLLDAGCDPSALQNT